MALRQIVEARIPLKQQLSEASLAVVMAEIAERVELCQRYLADLDRMLVDLVQDDLTTARIFEILSSVPGKSFL